MTSTSKDSRGGIERALAWTWERGASGLKVAATAIGRFCKAVWNGKPETPEESLLDTGAEPPPLQYSALDRGYKRFTRWTSYLAAVALGVITFVCFVDVITWKFFGWTLPSATDLVTYLNLVLVFLAAAYVQMDRGSVAIELLQNKFNRVVKLAVRIFASTLGAGSCFFASYRSWYQLADLYNTHAMATGDWHFRLWPFQAVLVFGFFCLGLAFLFTICRDVTNYRLRRGVYAPKPGKAPPTAGRAAVDS